ncbi:hypothetical protein KB575_00555 [Streptococcus canis]|uniref:hypothetical protein n=1 Tax=Streptococcus canis TaxID=1329 RepID=UPI0029490575|nr:hypothetical protein [Streptococcus canis]MDV5987559.1 hypothetical protein [Streptococcus canis]
MFYDDRIDKLLREQTDFHAILYQLVNSIPDREFVASDISMEVFEKYRLEQSELIDDYRRLKDTGTASALKRVNDEYNEKLKERADVCRYVFIFRILKQDRETQIAEIKSMIEKHRLYKQVKRMIFK